MKQSREQNNLYYFGPFTLDAAERVLLRDGQLVKIPAKTLHTLLVLVRNSGHLVEKDVLLHEVWPDEIVEEGNLAQHISMLRKVLGETESRKFIETIPRRGYLFLETVREFGRPRTEFIQPLISKRHTENAEAYEGYLRGRYYWSKCTTAALEQAAAWFGKTINLDPGFSLAYGAIIDCYLRLATNYLPPVGNTPKTAAELTRVDFEDGLHQAKAILDLRNKWDWKSAERECQRASELRSIYPVAHQWYAVYEFAQRLYYENINVGQLPAANANSEKTRTLDTDVLENIRFSRPGPEEELQIFCLIAREQIEAGNYEAACQVMQRWWTLGEWPQLDGLGAHSSADLLFTVGTLAGNVVSTRQVPRGQKHAEALLSGSIALFEQVNAKNLAAEGRVELALCYKREGLFDLARASLLAALSDLTNRDLELKSLVLMRLASLEHVAGRLQDALDWLETGASIVEFAGPWVTGRHLLELASTLKHVGPTKENPDNYEHAAAYYTEALYQFEAVGHHRLAAIAENNYGNLLLAMKRLEEAEPYLIRARRFFDQVGDKVRSAQVDETTAQLHLAAEQFDLAETVIARSVEKLEHGGEDCILAESLRTQGIVYGNLGQYRKAESILERAQQVSEHCGDVSGAERTRLIRAEVIVRLSDELKRSVQALKAFEKEAAERAIVEKLAQELCEEMTGAKQLLDQVLRNECEPHRTSINRHELEDIYSGLRDKLRQDELQQVGDRLQAISEKLLSGLKFLSEATARGIEISQQIIAHSKQASDT